MQNPDAYDVIVVGGGHAGTEAALAAARLGVRTLLLTHNIDTLGQMSCNPAIGGIGKGHLVREIDALGGIMARAADHCGIQFRRLNASKGPAVRATRAQIDRSLYKRFIRRQLETCDGLDIFQQAVTDLSVKNGAVTGVITEMGLVFNAPAVVLTVGTFLGGRIHIGLSNFAGGRAGDPPASALAERLRELPLRVDRLKTGTPPRLDARSVDLSGLDVQPSDRPLPVFSFMGNADQHPQQVDCHITYTNARTHDIIQAGLNESPMYSGMIESKGPRYCPSVEDKVVRFADKTAHQIFVEPEGLDAAELYPNGISTSLPYPTQIAMVRSIRGFEQARITRPGYAIEYDFFDPRDLRLSLETRHLPGLFFAGQINGTTGYEEAAAQGLIAGLNAARRVRGDAAWTPRRDQAYIGVMIDDLITSGAPEPYRMFTSRAEYRLQLREDNADLRLTEQARALGLIDDARWQSFTARRDAIAAETQRLRETWLKPGQLNDNDAIRVLGQPLKREATLLELLGRPEVSYTDLMSLDVQADPVPPLVAEQIEIQVRYRGYIERQAEEIERHRRHEHKALSADLDYADVPGLSNEVREILTRQRPETLGLASRLPGITPAAISLLLVYLKKHAGRRVDPDAA